MKSRDYTKFFNVTDSSEFFRSTPSLEKLTLIYCFPSQYHQDTGTDVEIIELPYLRELHLEERSNSWCSYFLGRLLLRRPPSEPMPRVRLGFYHEFGGSKGSDPIKSHLHQRFYDVSLETGHLELVDARDSDFRMRWKVHTRVISSEGMEAPIQSGPRTETCAHSHATDKKTKMLVSHEVCRSSPFPFVRVLVIEHADARF
jgi:hypothetical protein